MIVSTCEFETLEGGLKASYRWTPGPVVGRFLQALRDGPALLGARCRSCGQVACPPGDVCAGCGGASFDLEPVGPQGVVLAHAAVRVEVPGQPFAPPFAYVLVRLDGADTALPHVAPGEAGCALAVGDRVEARFRAERSGSILDLVGFVAADGAAPAPTAPPEGEPPPYVAGELDIPFRYSYGAWFPAFYSALRDGRILAARCANCGAVLLPPRPMCGACFVDVEPELVPVSDRGVVRTFTVVHMPYEGQPTEPPYCYALIVLDGADGEFHHIVREVDFDEVRVGMRVQARWRPPEERVGSFYDIECFVPEADGGAG